MATNSLVFNGGTIKDSALNNATLTLAVPGAAGSLGANKALVIDGVVPTLLTSIVNNATLTLTYDETLSGSTPATTDFVVNVNGVPVAVTGVSVSGAVVTLTLATPAGF